MDRTPTAPPESAEICLTFDVEERFHSHLSAPDAPRVWRMGERIAAIVDWLGAHGKTATCFLVGELAEQYPDLVRRMADIGCEIASHSHRHLWMAAADAQRCKQDITRSKQALEDITGRPVYGYRSPSWSARRGDRWLWDHLVDLGFVYDSSLFPFKTHMYGSWSNSPRPYWLTADLLEIPPAAQQFGPVRIPYGGGFYFRLYPSWLTAFLLQRDARAGRIPTLYFHPWEFELEDQAVERGWTQRFIGNVNVKSAWPKFERLIAARRTRTMIEHYHELVRSGDIPGKAVAD